MLLNKVYLRVWSELFYWHNVKGRSILYTSWINTKHNPWSLIGGKSNRAVTSQHQRHRNNIATQLKCVKLFTANISTTQKPGTYLSKQKEAMALESVMQVWTDRPQQRWEGRGGGKGGGGSMLLTLAIIIICCSESFCRMSRFAARLKMKGYWQKLNL